METLLGLMGAERALFCLVTADGFICVELAEDDRRSKHRENGSRARPPVTHTLLTNRERGRVSIPSQ